MKKRYLRVAYLIFLFGIVGCKSNTRAAFKNQEEKHEYIKRTCDYGFERVHYIDDKWVEKDTQSTPITKDTTEVKSEAKKDKK